MTTKAIGYVRVSSVGQVDGEGLGVQRDKIEAWCRYQGIDLVGIETDAGISGADTDNRPGFIEAMQKVLAIGDGVVLVVTKLDRLGRDALDIQEVIALLLNSSIRIVSLGDGIDCASGMGSAILKVLDQHPRHLCRTGEGRSGPASLMVVVEPTVKAVATLPSPSTDARLAPTGEACSGFPRKRLSSTWPSSSTSRGCLTGASAGVSTRLGTSLGVRASGPPRLSDAS